MPTQREMRTCPACGTGTLRPTGDSERIRNEETGEFGRHLKKAHGNVPEKNWMKKVAVLMAECGK